MINLRNKFPSSVIIICHNACVDETLVYILHFPVSSYPFAPRTKQ